MDKVILVEPDLIAGQEIVRDLDRRGISVDAALWLQDWDTGVWRLVLSSPAVTSLGPRRIYQATAEILGELPDAQIRLDDISVVGPHHSLVKDLRNVVRTNGDLHQIRLDNLELGGSRFRSARIYRVTGGSFENGARVRIKATDQLGTVRGVVNAPSGPRYLVLYDFRPEDAQPLGSEPRPPVGQDYAADDLELLYVVRTGGWPERLPRVTRPSSDSLEGAARTH